MLFLLLFLQAGEKEKEEKKTGRRGKRSFVDARLRA